jgi:hypothetical protein
VEHWRTPYLGLRDMPPSLEDFELTTFFSYSSAERRSIDARRQPLHRLAVALHLGFIRMTGRTLDVFEHIPKRLWSHIGEQVGVSPPEVASLRSLYTKRAQTLYDHQQVACEALGFQPMTEHQRRYVVRWLRETIAGRAGSTSLLPELKRWFYEHRILLIADRELKRFIAEAHRRSPPAAARWRRSSARPRPGRSSCRRASVFARAHGPCSSRRPSGS